MKNVLLLKDTRLGTVSPDDKEFGQTMMAKFLHNLESKHERIETIVCYTEGVKNALKGSDTALSLQVLQDLGVKILLCQTCLDHYGIKAENVVGTLSNMAEIVDTMTSADNIIKP